MSNNVLRVNLLIAAGTVAGLSACSTSMFGGRPRPDLTAYNALEAAYDRIEPLGPSFPSVQPWDLPASGTAEFAGIISFRMDPPSGTTTPPDYPANNRTLGDLALAVDFGGANPVTATASGFVDNRGHAVAGALTSGPGTGTIGRTLFPLGVALNGTLTESDGDVRATALNLSGLLSGPGALHHIYGPVSGTMSTNGTLYADIAGGFTTEVIAP